MGPRPNILLGQITLKLLVRLVKRESRIDSLGVVANKMGDEEHLVKEKQVCHVL